MGAVKAWIAVLVGFFILGATFLFTQPMFDLLFAFANAWGYSNIGAIQTVKTGLQVIPYFIGISLILWGFLSGTKKEDDSRLFFYR